MRRPLFFLLLFSVILFFAFVMSGCRVDTTMDVSMHRDGGGDIEVEARLDKEASAAAPDLARQLRIDDLKARGWKIDGPSLDGEETVVKASHGFANVDEANALFTHVGPAEGPLRDFRLTQERTITRVDSGFRGTVDLRRGIESWGDPVLAQRVGAGLGFDPAELQRGTGVDLQQAFTFRVGVSMPGDVQRSGLPVEADGKWSPPYGQSVDLAADASGWNLRTIGYLVSAAVAAVGAIALFLFWKPYAPRHQQKLSERLASSKSRPAKGEGKGGDRFR